MSRKVVKAPKALADIERLYRGGLDLFGEAQAERLHREIYRRFDLLAENPMLGPERREIAAGLRLSFLPAPVAIAYRFTDAEVIVPRGFHSREDYQSLILIGE